VVPVEGRIKIGGARAAGVSFLFFFFSVFTSEFACVMDEKEKRDCRAEGRVT